MFKKIRRKCYTVDGKKNPARIDEIDPYKPPGAT